MSTLKRLKGRLLGKLFPLIIDGPLGRIPGLVTLYTHLYRSTNVEIRTSVDGQLLEPAVMPDGWLLYYTDQNEQEVRTVFKSLVSEGMYVVDVGASIGPFTLVAANAVAPSGSVLAFEPNPVRFDCLRQNVALNDASNVTCSNDAVGGENAEREISIDASGTFTENQGTVVQTTTLDERLSESPDVVKIDVEGGEFDVLAGMTDILSKAAPEILIEVHPEFITDFDSLASEWETKLTNLGYTIYRIQPLPALQEVSSFRDERTHYLLTTGNPPDLSTHTT